MTFVFVAVAVGLATLAAIFVLAPVWIVVALAVFELTGSAGP